MTTLAEPVHQAEQAEQTDATVDTGTEEVAASSVVNVVPLARRRVNPASSASSPQEALTGEELARFNELVRQLEVADGRPLHGSGRTDCAHAFRTYPAGFAAAVDEARDADVDSHRGLLVSFVRPHPKTGEVWVADADAIAAARQQKGAIDGDRFAAYDA